MFPKELELKYRREMFPRFLFGVYRQAFINSKVGFIFDVIFVIPKRFMVFADQTEERIIIGMKSAGGARNCTLCDMISKVT